MKKVLLNWLSGDDTDLYLIDMTEEEWEEVKIANNHYLGESLVEDVDQYKSNMRAVSMLVMAIDTPSRKQDYIDWANELEVHHSWVGKFNHYEKIASGPIFADELLSTGYYY